MKISRFVAACATYLLLGAGSASAVVVSPGSTVALPGTTSAAEPWLAGTVLVDQITNVTFGSFSANVQERVVAENGTGFLDFYWRIYGIGGRNVVTSFRLGDFVYGVFDANYRTDGLGSVAPSSILRFSGANESFANFLFSSAPLGNGNGSDFFFLHTTATQYAETAKYDLTFNGGISGTYATFAPAVPEPETYAMILAGLGMIGFMARRRRSN